MTWTKNCVYGTGMDKSSAASEWLPGQAWCLLRYRCSLHKRLLLLLQVARVLLVCLCLAGCRQRFAGRCSLNVVVVSVPDSCVCCLVLEPAGVAVQHGP